MAKEHPRSRTISRLAIVTGDPSQADPTKLGARYGAEDMACHEAMVKAISSLSRFELQVFNDHRTLFSDLLGFAPDLVVNFCDTGINNQPTQELHLPAWLELHDIPYTGATPQTMVLCFDKQIVRLVAQSLSIPVPQEVFIAAPYGIDTLPELYPALIKPNTADGSVGITKDAVVRDQSQARVYLEFLQQTLPGRDVLWQEYLPGPEYGLGLIGNPNRKLITLPPLEVDFSALPSTLNPILSFESKADPDSPYWKDIKFKRAAVDAATLDQLSNWARLLFARLGLRDYARFDFRCASDGRPRLMEVNPNPAWANDGKLAFMAAFSGLSYPQMLEAILDAAITRVTV